jgi:acetoacetyl-CoA synthetase
MENGNGAAEVNPLPATQGLMWRPESVKDHQLTILRQQINDEHGIELKDYHDLHKWSCDNYGLFWGHVWDFCGVVASVKPDKVVDKTIPINKVPKWFPGAKMNYAENLLRYPKV